MFEEGSERVILHFPTQKYFGRADVTTRAASVVGEHPYVEQRSNMQGGRPVIKGSRFPVSSIVQDYRRGWSVEEILREFPQLRPAEVHDALSYYYDHQAKIDWE